MSKLDNLINYLLSERNDLGSIEIPEAEQDKFRLYRSLVNIRPAWVADESYLQAEDENLTSLTESKGITDISDLTPIEDGIYLWKGDITTLRSGAIVNAANSGMTGCYQPCHSCIDNCIHTFAGVRLRYECSQIMERQGHEEPTGKAKITKAYNLPCAYVIHTVGPIVQGQLTDEHCRLLESSYQSCLELAVQNGIKSIAFCCISTGVFGFPQDKAAEIAVRTVRKFRRSHDIQVIFNVFREDDYELYKQLLG
ncbi:O-acetyl-ADP-ribose deacetylase (regulator of RNase III), contains Macro domain [Ruminococcus sp. YE71]|uniref:protein-ADP-ribose hydrolase n=1 Tax=Ruminococcus sp. YE71 TaxID=244362 RepID=UPI0009084FF1|nr:protein-ADP-ribose hydrolase [Ruminococcus sp. YE71]SFW52930.1 O-acetyl-ADP-ribose deacetylase (regulator of RNase III), contains Macro domain [Ruminococcus sp. YE71]